MQEPSLRALALLYPEQTEFRRGRGTLQLELLARHRQSILVGTNILSRMIPDPLTALVNRALLTGPHLTCQTRTGSSEVDIFLALEQ